MSKSGPRRRTRAVGTALETLIAAVRSRLHQAGDIPIDACARFDEAFARAAQLRLQQDIGPDGPAAALPVTSLWSAALDAAHGNVPDLAEPLRALAPALRWTQNPNYRAAPPAPDFLSRYGYAQLVGPRGAPTLLTLDSLAFGVLMLAPGTLYPAHAHPAEEFYLPLAEARWQRGAEAWRERHAGEIVHHPPAMVHATEAGRMPLLALYGWLGAIETAARILDA